MTRSRRQTVIRSASDDNTSALNTLIQPRRKYVFRIVLLLVAPALTLLLLEGALRVAGYGYPTTFFVKSKSSDEYITNDKFAWQFFSKKSPLKPFLFKMPAKKATGTIRMCILGESAAMGTPDPAFSFGRILEVLLRSRYPNTRFEIINAAMRGINSHVIQTIAAECARHEIDVFIVYTGNNEVIGLHCPKPDSPAWTQSLWLIRTGDWLKSTRLGQLLSNLFVPARAPESDHKQDMLYFRAHSLRADDWRREKNRGNFRANLQDICHAARRGGAKVMLSTIAVNLTGCPPFESLHRADLSTLEKTRWESTYEEGIELEAKREPREAIARFNSALQVDDHFAELHFRLAKCFCEVGDIAQARQHYEQALNWDALQFRTDAEANKIIEETAAAGRGTGVTMVDAAAAFSANELSNCGGPGERLFHDHVHPTFAGNYLIARACIDGLASELGSALPGPASVDLPTKQECADALAYTLYDELNVITAMVRLTSDPPFLDQADHSRRQRVAEADIQARLKALAPKDAEHCLETYRKAIARRPDDWPIRFNLGAFYEELHQYQPAAEQFRWLVQQFPNYKAFRFRLGNVLVQSGDKSAALIEFNEGLKIDPEDQLLKAARDELQGK